MSQSPDNELRFVIDVFTPDTLPMERLAQYMAEYARLLGEPTSVHFSRLEHGSTAVVSRVDEPSFEKVQSRVRDLAQGTGTEDVVRAYRTLDGMLARDNAVGHLEGGDGAKIISFPGRSRPQPRSYGPFNQEGTLDGILIRIGGKDKTVHAHLLDGHRIHPCIVTREQARELAQHIFGPVVRVKGLGRWRRDEEGRWHLERFKVWSFETLGDTALREILARLRSVQGNKWSELSDPIGEALRMRGEGGDHE